MPFRVYIIHLEEPLSGIASHYVGFTNSLERRIKEHRAGTGSKMLRAANDAGIAYKMVKTWRGGWRLERYIKKQGHHARYCPICSGKKAKNPIKQLKESESKFRPARPEKSRRAVLSPGAPI